MKTLITKINEISEAAKNQFKPDLKKYGKNFRAISESAVLEVLNPLFKEHGIAYEVIIQSKSLHIEKLKAGRDNAGNLIEKLLFVAEAQVMLVFTNPEAMFNTEKGEAERMAFQGWGSGVDYGDKATGKAITSAVKYALFKGLRLQYSDDPDAEESKEIENICSTEELDALAEERRRLAQKYIEQGEQARKKETSKNEAKKEEPLATDAQLNYIKGLIITCGMTDEDFKKKYGLYPHELSDKKLIMKKAREMIEELKKLADDKLPF